MRKRSRIAGLRMPFVVTATVGAVACGGSVTGAGGSAGSEAGGAGTGGGAPVIQNPPSVTTVCPTAQPGQGMYCDYSGAPCLYNGCGSTTATCTNNLWELSYGSCNPPPPVETTCPPVEPSGGAYCNYQGPPCAYEHGDTIDGGDCNASVTYVQCEGYGWQRSGVASACADTGIRDAGTLVWGD